MLASVATRKSIGSGLALYEPEHRLGPADEVAQLADIGRALGMSEGQGLGHPLLEADQVEDAEDLVDHARAVPEDHRPAGHALQVRPEVLVGDEEDFLSVSGTRRMISSALPEVTIQSDSALTAAVLLM